MDDQVWMRAADEAPVRRGGLGRGLAAIIPARAENATGRLPHLVLRRAFVPGALLSRAALTDRLDAALAEGAREELSLAVVVLGLDGFRHVNSRLGQQAGDDLLAALGERLAGSRRASDAIGHLDGDVFAVVCPRVDSFRAGARVIGRLAQDVARPLGGPGAEERLGATFGLALGQAGCATPGRVLLRRAEMAMLRAKDEGAPWAAYEAGSVRLASGPDGRSPGGTAEAGEPRKWADRRLRLGR